ncbi:DDE family transposase [Actinokineospora auranticolor]|uniref:DDE family transposase n=1 Tax=Actinokineospora auranticolor TaxID=155976 RepID=A0A2S6H0W5_9PSEU|nr:DDE family transposase [Actinokineospora auranticolor]
MVEGRWSWVVPEGWWEVARPLLPAARVRPRGGGVRNIDDEAVFAAIVYVLVSGCAWRALPPCFGAARSTAHRRFTIWARTEVFARLHRKSWRECVDRGKPGTKVHILSDRTGMPLVTAVPGGNTPDIDGLKPMITALLSRHRPDRGRHWKPRKLHADKAYDSAEVRNWLRRHRILARIARCGIDSSQRLVVTAGPSNAPCRG